MNSLCPGCYLQLPITNYPADNRYGVSSNECRQLFDEVLVKEGELFGYPPAHRLIIDSYAVQHPPHLAIQQKLNIEPRMVAASVQSIAIHLIALYAALELKIPLLEISSIMRNILNTMNQQKIDFPELTAPENLGEIIVDQIHKQLYEGELTLDKYTKLALQWAECSWNAWHEHHELIKKWYEKFKLA